MSPKTNRIAPNVKTVRVKGKTYYYYFLPDGSREPLGSDRTMAIEAANALNVALRKSGSLVERVLKRAASPHENYNPRNPPMMQVIDEYLNDQLKDQLARGKIGQKTYTGKTQLLNEYTKAFGKITCQQMKTYDLAQHIKDRTGNVQHKHLPLMKQMFRYAIAQGYRETNPANELQPKTPEARVRKRHTWEGFKQVRAAAPAWLQRTMDIALYSLQRRSDLILMHKDHVSTAQRSIDILQQKTRNYAKPVYIQITMGDSLWHAVDSALTSDIPCPFLVHCRPKMINARIRAAKPHPFAVLPDFLSAQFSKARDASGAYEHLPRKERPSLHDIRALGILMYHKAGYPMEYIMALAGHAKATTTELYIDGHEQIKPIAVNAGLSLDQVNIDNIDWRSSILPPELEKLIDEGDV